MKPFETNQLYGYKSTEDTSEPDAYLVATDTNRNLWIGSVRFPAILDTQQAEKLIPMLQEYVKTGELPVPDEQMPIIFK